MFLGGFANGGKSRGEGRGLSLGTFLKSWDILGPAKRVCKNGEKIGDPRSGSVTMGQKFWDPRSGFVTMGQKIGDPRSGSVTMRQEIWDP